MKTHVWQDGGRTRGAFHPSERRARVLRPCSAQCYVTRDKKQVIQCARKYTYPGYDPPLSNVSTKNWLSKSPGVESKGVPGMVGSTWSAAAIVCLGRRYDARLGDANVAYEVSKATTASGPNPASSKRSSMVSTLSAGYSRYI